MSGPDKSAEEKAEDARRQAEAYGKVTLDTSKSFVTWIFGLWAKFAIGCVIVGVLFLFVTCNLIGGMLR